MKKAILALGLALLLLAAAVTISGCVQEPQGETVKIGAIYQETGNGAAWGEKAEKGLMLAVEKINGEGGIHGMPVEIIFEDSKSTVKDAVTSMEKLATVDGVKAVLSQQSSIVMALSPIANGKKVILMDSGSTTPAYVSPDDFTFRVSYNATYFAKEIASFLNKKGVKSLAGLHVNNDYGLAMTNAYKGHFNGAIVAEEIFGEEETDFRTQIQKIKEANPDAVVYTSSPAQAGIMLRQKKEQGLESTFYTDIYSIEYPEVLESAGNAAEGTIYVSQYYDTNRTDSVFKEFNGKFIERYGEVSDPLAAQAYDGLLVLAFAMNQCQNQEDTECIKEKLFSIKDFQGVIGPITFDNFGEIKERPTVLKTVKNGEFVLYEGS